MEYDPSNINFAEWLASKFRNHKTMDWYTKNVLWIYWTRGDDEEVLTDEENSDLEDENLIKENKIAEIFRIETDIFDFEIPLCKAFKEFNYLLKIEIDVLTNDIDMSLPLVREGKEGDVSSKGRCVWSDVVPARRNKWVGEVKLNEHFPRLFQLENKKDILVGDRGNWIDDIWAWNWDWNRSPQRRVLDPKGEFSVKSLSQWIEQLLVRREAGITKTKWNTLVPRKVNVFIWRALNGRIHVRNELDKKGIVLVDVCTIKDILQHYALDKEAEVLWRAMILVALYFIWKSRNMKVFKGKTENGMKLCKDIQVKAFEWISGRSKRWNL
ncbi:VIER F-box protein 2 [Tanacetum coccineum]